MSFTEEVSDAPISITGEMWVCADSTGPSKVGAGRGLKNFITIEKDLFCAYSSRSAQSKQTKQVAFRSMKRVAWFTHRPTPPVRGSSASTTTAALRRRGSKDVLTVYYYLVLEFLRDNTCPGTVSLGKRERIVLCTDDQQDFLIWRKFADLYGSSLVHEGLVEGREKRSLKSQRNADGVPDHDDTTSSDDDGEGHGLSGGAVCRRSLDLWKNRCVALLNDFAHLSNPSLQVKSADIFEAPADCGGLSWDAHAESVLHAIEQGMHPLMKVVPAKSSEDHIVGLSSLLSSPSTTPASVLPGASATAAMVTHVDEMQSQADNLRMELRRFQEVTGEVGSLVEGSKLKATMMSPDTLHAYLERLRKVLMSSEPANNVATQRVDKTVTKTSVASADLAKLEGVCKAAVRSFTEKVSTNAIPLSEESNRQKAKQQEQEELPQRMETVVAVLLDELARATADVRSLKASLAQSTALAGPSPARNLSVELNELRRVLNRKELEVETLQQQNFDASRQTKQLSRRLEEVVFSYGDVAHDMLRSQYREYASLRSLFLPALCGEVPLDSSTATEASFAESSSFDGIREARRTSYSLVPSSGMQKLVISTAHLEAIQALEQERSAARERQRELEEVMRELEVLRQERDEEIANLKYNFLAAEEAWERDMAILQAKLSAVQSAVPQGVDLLSNALLTNHTTEKSGIAQKLTSTPLHATAAPVDVPESPLIVTQMAVKRQERLKELATLLGTTPNETSLEDDVAYQRLQAFYTWAREVVVPLSTTSSYEGSLLDMITSVVHAYQAVLQQASTIYTDATSSKDDSSLNLADIMTNEHDQLEKLWKIIDEHLLTQELRNALVRSTQQPLEERAALSFSSPPTVAELDQLTPLIQHVSSNATLYSQLQLRSGELPLALYIQHLENKLEQLEQTLQQNDVQQKIIEDRSATHRPFPQNTSPHNDTIHLRGSLPGVEASPSEPCGAVVARAAAGAAERERVLRADLAAAEERQQAVESRLEAARTEQERVEADREELREGVADALAALGVEASPSEPCGAVVARAAAGAAERERVLRADLAAAEERQQAVESRLEAARTEQELGVVEGKQNGSECCDDLLSDLSELILRVIESKEVCGRDLIVLYVFSSSVVVCCSSTKSHSLLGGSIVGREDREFFRVKLQKLFVELRRLEALGMIPDGELLQYDAPTVSVCLGNLTDAVRDDKCDGESGELCDESLSPLTETLMEDTKALRCESCRALLREDSVSSLSVFWRECSTLIKDSLMTLQCELPHAKSAEFEWVSCRFNSLPVESGVRVACHEIVAMIYECVDSQRELMDIVKTTFETLVAVSESTGVHGAPNSGSDYASFSEYSQLPQLAAQTCEEVVQLRHVASCEDALACATEERDALIRAVGVCCESLYSAISSTTLGKTSFRPGTATILTCDEATSALTDLTTLTSNLLHKYAHTMRQALALLTPLVGVASNTSTAASSVEVLAHVMEAVQILVEQMERCQLQVLLARQPNEDDVKARGWRQDQFPALCERSEEGGLPLVDKHEAQATLEAKVAPPQPNWVSVAEVWTRPTEAVGPTVRARDGSGLQHADVAEVLPLMRQATLLGLSTTAQEALQSRLSVILGACECCTVGNCCVEATVARKSLETDELLAAVRADEDSLERIRALVNEGKQLNTTMDVACEARGQPVTQAEHVATREQEEEFDIGVREAVGLVSCVRAATGEAKRLGEEVMLAQCCIEDMQVHLNRAGERKAFHVEDDGVCLEAVGRACSLEEALHVVAADCLECAKRSLESKEACRRCEIVQDWAVMMAGVSVGLHAEVMILQSRVVDLKAAVLESETRESSLLQRLNALLLSSGPLKTAVAAVAPSRKCDLESLEDVAIAMHAAAQLVRRQEGDIDKLLACSEKLKSDVDDLNDRLRGVLEECHASKSSLVSLEETHGRLQCRMGKLERQVYDTFSTVERLTTAVLGEGESRRLDKGTPADCLDGIAYLSDVLASRAEECDTVKAQLFAWKAEARDREESYLRTTASLSTLWKAFRTTLLPQLVDESADCRGGCGVAVASSDPVEFLPSESEARQAVEVVVDTADRLRCAHDDLQAVYAVLRGHFGGDAASAVTDGTGAPQASVLSLPDNSTTFRHFDDTVKATLRLVNTAVNAKCSSLRGFIDHVVSDVLRDTPGCSQISFAALRPGAFVEWLHGLLTSLRTLRDSSDRHHNRARCLPAFMDALVETIHSYGGRVDVTSTGATDVLTSADATVPYRHDLAAVLEDWQAREQTAIVHGLQALLRRQEERVRTLTAEWQDVTAQYQRLSQEQAAAEEMVMELRRRVQFKVQEDYKLEESLRELDSHLDQQARELAMKYCTDQDAIVRRFTVLRDQIHATVRPTTQLTASVMLPQTPRRGTTTPHS